MKEELTVNGKRIILVGTAHISQASIAEVEQVIEEVKPDAVCVELCAQRYSSLSNPDHWKKMDIIKVVKEGKAPMLMVNFLLSAFQKKMGDKLGVLPGAEMAAAVKACEKFGAKLVLADRDISVTFKRAWRTFTFWEKIKFFFQIIESMFQTADISEEEVESLKQSDMLTEAIEEMAKAFPAVKSTLIDERDRYQAAKIAEAEGETIVAVVGAGHLPGIAKHINEQIDTRELEKVPPPGKIGKILKWAIPAIVFALIGYGFWTMDADVSLEMIKRWVLANGILAALGAAVAGGHILTIIAAFVASPITSLNPAIAAGWVSGLVEAWLRKPRVEDFESLPQDITTLRRLRKNKVTVILLVTILSNIGSSLGAIIGIPLISSLFYGG